MFHSHEIKKEVLHEWQKEISIGNDRVFRLMFDYYGERLTNFAFSFVRNREAAIEIMDAVFVSIWKNRSNLSTIENLTTYLYTAIKNRSLNYLSQKAKQQVAEPFDFINIELSHNDSPEQRLIHSEIMAQIQAAVEALPPRCKIIFKLVREDGLKYKEAAEVLNISEKTVDAQMVIAIKKISEKVKSRFDNFPKAPSKTKSRFKNFLFLFLG